MPEPTPIAALHPTQLTLGMREVERRAKEITALAPRKREGYVVERVVPCVRGPGSRLYLIDRHHMCRALLSVGSNEVQVDVLADTQQLGREEFWTFMDLRGWVHPFDAEGRRCPISSLAPNIADLVDDPYRALAGFLRREKGFKKEETPFEEFIWADFLRRRVDKALLSKDFDAAKAFALELALSNSASHLPGWRKSK